MATAINTGNKALAAKMLQAVHHLDRLSNCLLDTEEIPHTEEDRKLLAEIEETEGKLRDLLLSANRRFANP